MDGGRAELEAFHRRYIQRCNERRFGDLGEFVDRDVEVNGEPRIAEVWGDLDRSRLTA